MKDKRCRICDSTELKQILYIPRAPRNIERLLEPQSFDRDTPVELKVFQCLDCSHVQLAEELANDYYEEYLMTHSHAKKMQEYQKNQASEFIQHFNLKGARVFESGCGDGQFSLILKDMGCEVLANEPSAKARLACEAKGLTTIGNYVGADAFPELTGQFDAVVARQVLEHVPDPNDFMKGMKELLKPGGVGLIEVPSIEQALENSRFFDFFPDHLSYFSSQALMNLFSRNSFDVVRIARTMDGEYNEAWIKRQEVPDFNQLQKAADSISGAFSEFLAHEAALGRKAAIWGAGAKGVLTLSMVNVGSIAYLIDLDPVKQGRFTPVSHLQVSSPERLLTEPVDTIIITALAYKDEIIRDLNTKYSFKGKITCLMGGKIAEV